MASFGELSLLGEVSVSSTVDKKNGYCSSGTVALENGQESSSFVAVQIEKHGIEIYNLKEERLFASCPLPEKTIFSCKPMYLHEGNSHYIWACTSSARSRGEWKLLSWKYDELKEHGEVRSRDLSNKPIFSIHFIASSGQLVLVFTNGEISFLDPEDDMIQPATSIQGSASLVQTGSVSKQVEQKTEGTPTTGNNSAVEDGISQSQPGEGLLPSVNSSATTTNIYLLYALSIEKIQQFYVSVFSTSEKRLLYTKPIELGSSTPPIHVLLAKDCDNIFGFFPDNIFVYASNESSGSYQRVKSFQLENMPALSNVDIIFDKFCLVQTKSQVSIWDLTYGTIQDVFNTDNDTAFITVTINGNPSRKSSSKINSTVSGNIILLQKKAIASVPFTMPAVMSLADAIGKRKAKIGRILTKPETIADGALTKSKSSVTLCEQLLKNVQLQDNSLRNELHQLQTYVQNRDGESFDAKFLKFVEGFQTQNSTNRKLLKTNSVLPIPFVHAIESILFSSNEEQDLDLLCPAKATLNYLLRNRLFTSSILRLNPSRSLFNCIYKFQKESALLLLERTLDLPAFEVGCAIKKALSSMKTKLLKIGLLRLSQFDSAEAQEALLLTLAQEDFDLLFKLICASITGKKTSVPLNLDMEILIYIASTVLDAMGVGGIAASTENQSTAQDLYSGLQSKITSLTAMSLVLPAVSELIKHRKKDVAENTFVHPNPQPKAVIDDKADLATLLRKDGLAEQRKNKSQRARGKELDMTIGRYTIERLEI
ncbi:t-UTP complex subunit Utp8 [Schizosaccharomyces osmophilus]|uniref:T-UTP complex subunit Utp8 n=1 Tax=Schizosaccharomyces osmophilus TaxID=2545709 RepID=A0AAE9WB76_9SCHI|nr:t-UTP complex subunit Utp8 [Schizosaccharomyces osmophilus]WBW73034.1 t-UTP complex subunit Utp8 [Schizosaccharomyces osmophilus]